MRELITALVEGNASPAIVEAPLTSQAHQNSLHTRRTPMQIIDISKPGFLDILRASTPVQVGPNFKEFRITWGDIVPEGVGIKIYAGSIPGQDPTTAGLFDPFDYGISVATYGREQNKIMHRGGLEGTVVHEWAHLLQCFGTDNDLGGWYFTNHHDEQSALFQKWKSVLAGAYAGEQPYEATAEVFRVLGGWRSSDEWERNTPLLEDWKAFLKGNEVFKDFMP